METVLKYERVILTKELNDKFKKVGEVFEVANVFEYGFLLRDTMMRTAIGVISFEDFERCFVKEEEFKGWTPWIQLAGEDGRTDAFYRTNGRRVEVKFVTDKVRATACCHADDEFNLFFGIQIAYYRCENKALVKKVKEYEQKLLKAFDEIEYNENVVNNMIKRWSR